MTAKNRQRIILCCGANGRAVIIGDVDKKPVKGQAVTLHNARMVLYWHERCGGLLGMAANGPRGSTRITAAIPWTTETVWQEACAVSAKAAKEIDAWPAC